MYDRYHKKSSAAAATASSSPFISFLGNTLLSKTFASVTVVGEVPLQVRSPEGGAPQGVPEPVLAGYDILDQSRGYA